MSAKKKQKFEWKLCARCETYFPRSVCVKHEKICGDITGEHIGDDAKSFEEGTNVEGTPDSGFIKNGVLHGICKYIDSTFDLLPTTKNDLIIVHPSAIKLCNFQVTSTVLINYEGKQTCGTIWPSSSIPVDGVGLRMAKIKTLDLSLQSSIVSVQLCDSPWIIAGKVYLEPLCDAAGKKFSSILPTLLLDLDGGNIMKGDFVSIPYYGDEMFYLVTDIVGDYTNEAEDDETMKIYLEDSKKTVNTKLTDTYNGATVDDIDVMQLDETFHALSVNRNMIFNHNSDFTTCKEGNHKGSVSVFLYNVMINSTQLVLSNFKTDCSKVENNDEVRSTLHMMGGLNTQIKLLEDLIAFPFTFPSLFNRCGIASPKGIIIYGESGTGKTELVHGFVNKLNVYNATINGPELTSKFHGETEQKLRDLFNKTKSKAPSILIIDEFDAICPSRTSSSSEPEKRVVATLLTLLDSIQKDDIFVVIAITSKLEQIDMALRRPGRFDREIEISVPNASERCDILQKLICGCKHSLSDEDIVDLSTVTHGYVGSDLSALVKEAGMIAMKGTSTNQGLSPLTNENQNIEDFVQTFSITIGNFRSAMCNVRPSAMKAVMIDIPKVFWTDIGGQHSVKQKMKEAIEWPLKHPDVFKRLGITPPRGLLMYGPPGCSKTLIAKALATESGLNFISIKGPELFNKYLGESERAIRDVFRKARVSAPSIIFFDEIDAVGVQRSNKDSGSNNVGDRVLAQLLTELDGVESLEGVIIIAATNRPDIIDPALLRPGRIDRLVYVPLPDDNTRKEIFEIQFRSIPISNDVELDTMVAMSARYSGAEICSLCREAAMCALRENFECNEVSLRHFENIFSQLKPAISAESISFYDDFKNKTTGSF